MSRKFKGSFNVNCSPDYMNKFRADLFIHIRKMVPVMKSICSKHSSDRTRLSKKLPLKSLECVYLSRVFDSVYKDSINWYSHRRTAEICKYIKNHELLYFKGKEKPALILKVESWCKDRTKMFFGFPESASFELVCFICENIVHWQKKSRWDLNVPKDRAEDFILESLEVNMYDWLRCISNDKEESDIIRDPIRLKGDLSKLRSKPVNRAEMLEVTNFYLSLFVELKFLTILEREDLPSFVCPSAGAILSSVPASISKRYVLGTFCWTIHQDTGVVPFFPFDLKDGINQSTFWNIIKRNNEGLSYLEGHRYSFLYHRFFQFSPTKKNLSPAGMQRARCDDLAFLCTLPLIHSGCLPFLRAYAPGQDIWGEILIVNKLNVKRAGHLFYVMDFHYREYLDLAALDCYDIEVNSQRYCIDNYVFIDYYAWMEKSDEHVYRWGNFGDKEFPS